MVRRLFVTDRFDWLWVKRALRACTYNAGMPDETTVYRALERGKLEYYLVNERCGGGVWWTAKDECWLVLFYREGPPSGLRADAKLLRQAYETSVAAKGGARVMASVDAENPHGKQLLWLHEKVMGLRQLQTITARDMRQ